MKLEGLYRVDVPEISVAAMREAIINAFCHRDYRDPDYVQVAIFKDRVEIRNPGELYGGLTIDQIRKGNVSRRRNPLIAELLRRIQMVETWGRGMRLILAEEPTVQFEEVAQLFIAAFNRPSYAEVGKTIDKTTDKGPSSRQMTPLLEAQVGAKSGPSRDQVKMLRQCTEERSIADLMGIAGRRSRTKFRDQVLNPAMQEWDYWK